MSSPLSGAFAVVDSDLLKHSSNCNATFEFFALYSTANMCGRASYYAAMDEA
jgi:hypothetical protein